MTFGKLFFTVGATCLVILAIVFLTIRLSVLFAFLFFVLLIGVLVFTVKRTKRHPTVYTHYFKDYRFFFNERDEKLIRALSRDKLGYTTSVGEDDWITYPYVNELFYHNYLLSILEEEDPQEVISRFQSLSGLGEATLSYSPPPLGEAFAGKTTLNCINSITETLRKQGIEVINLIHLGSFYSLGVIPVNRLHEITEFLVKD